MNNKICLPINPELNSIYLLWWVLTYTTDEVTAYCVHLPTPSMYLQGSRHEGPPPSPSNLYATAPREDIKVKTDSIVSYLKSNVRNFVYETLTMENYDAKWSSVSQFEVIEKAKSTGLFDKVYQANTRESFCEYRSKPVYEKIAIGFPVECPISSLTLAEACNALPDDLLSLSTDRFVAARKKMFSDGMSIDEISAKELSIYNRIYQNPGASWAPWVDKYFGNLSRKEFEKPFEITHPYYAYLIKD